MLRHGARVLLLLALPALAEDRLWFHEEEFAADPSLRAAPGQVVILHLESTPKGKLARQTIPFRFSRTEPFRFCVPKDDPHIKSLELLRGDSPAVLVQVPRGGPCKARTIEAGDYRLVVTHDGDRIGAAGKKAFLHVPRFRRSSSPATGGRRTALASVATAAGSFPASCDPGFFSAPQHTLAAGGRYLDAAPGSPVFANDRAPDAFLAGWTICPDGEGGYTLGHPGGFKLAGEIVRPTFLVAFPPGDQPTPIRLLETSNGSRFRLTDLGNGEFTMTASAGGVLYPVVLDQQGVLSTAASGEPSVLSVVLRYYPPGLASPAPQPGEAAFYQGCLYDDSAGTYVFPADVADLAGLRAYPNAPLDDSFASVRVGSTVALYPDAAYGGAVTYLSEDAPCLTAPTLRAISSLRVHTDRAFVAATLQCKNCNLSGVDLSGLDLSGRQFQGSTFSGANLTGTRLQSATLDDAHLGGATTLLEDTVFYGAVLRCTSFSGADLTGAKLQTGDVLPVLATDFGCRLDLSGTDLNVDSLPLAQWRYADLTGARFTGGLAGVTLSTTAAPLDLSGAILNETDLHGVHLDGADLGCAPGAAGQVCAQLRDANLHSATLKKTKLVSANLQGAELDYANFDGANLCGVKLNRSEATSRSASLQGAFLHAVSLAQADLTGASLDNANFYSGVAVTTCLPGADCAATSSCASAVNATLANASFTGAYLSGVDFSGSSPQGVDFSGAFLVGANFTNANLSEDPDTGTFTNFNGAYLQGATFTQANVKDASFINAYLNLTGGATVLKQLGSANLQMAGYAPKAGKTFGCVEFTHSHATTPPTTDSGNVCPDGSSGPCANASWTAPLVPMPALPADCTSSLVDFNWLFPPN